MTIRPTDRVIHVNRGTRTTYTGPHKQRNDDGRGSALVERDGVLVIVPVPFEEAREREEG